MTLRARFTDMKNGDQEDWTRIAAQFFPFAAKLPDRVLDHLHGLGGDGGGFAVDRLTHSLQTATRAQADGRDEEYVVCALLHDIGDGLCSYNHAAMAAAILKPFVSPENHWMVENHDVFQGHYFFHFIGRDRHARDRFAEHPSYARTVEFCALYDAPAFDPDYQTLPLDAFEPALRRVLAAPRMAATS
ncbi:putative HD phosphohydrolase [Caulobacter ginsengisoli]|uniref:HD phosphohydrolase n=1 Tax=Caulobacter ginsengisoli TaxID=400775 RepID=A0ABU0IQU0_9CAUL|nr:HD domain-containing protein [Caulobacter ginsengisoli]MDQ0463711.1 putative HD phosphohydrolase [Caulobacter ginsengisoli]